MEILYKIKSDLDKREAELLSRHATHSAAALRQKSEDLLETSYRQAFAIDVDRILHSLAYTRYIDKTQVFYLIHNDHITHRVLHVQLVSKVARTIGRFLGLNEDLIEAIALGHDIGHAPFGHEGETFLSEICQSHGIGWFHHNLQSVQFLDKVENKGKGCNLSLQTLDGILCHDGEIHNRTLEPAKNKTFDQLKQEMALKKTDHGTSLIPMTLEGCVVRFSDTISYIGRDIEDAIRLNLIKRADLPEACVSLLGKTNGTIVYNLVTDIINSSFGKPSIAFSPEVSDALKKLKRFNYEHIYLNPKIKKHSGKIRELFTVLFERYLKDLETGNKSSVIFSNFLEDMSEDYVNFHSHGEIVRDFISGMTDKYFLEQCPSELRPGQLSW